MQRMEFRKMFLVSTAGGMLMGAGLFACGRNGTEQPQEEGAPAAMPSAPPAGEGAGVRETPDVSTGAAGGEGLIRSTETEKDVNQPVRKR